MQKYNRQRLDLLLTPTCGSLVVVLAHIIEQGSLTDKVKIYLMIACCMHFIEWMPNLY